MKPSKWLALFSAGLVAAASMPVHAAAADAIPVSGNLVRITTADDFSASELTELTVLDTIGNGAVTLADPAEEGELISGVYDCPAFTNLVASWNADTPDDSSIEITARGRISETGEWTQWLSWGVWGIGIARGCGTPDTARDKLAYVDTDVLALRDDSLTFDRFQLRATLRRSSTGLSPTLRQLSATFQNWNDGAELTPVYAEEPTELPEKAILSTPAYSQMVRDPDISASICNPTTITTLLNDRGEDLLPEQVALVDYDFNYQGFGNWSFALAAAASFGYDCYIQYGSFDLIRQELAKGYSVGISVYYAQKEGGRLPYVENAPITSTGHLITVRGYENVDGVEYFYVSDSAAGSDAEALRRYRADQLDAAWGNRILYLVHEKEANAGTAAPHTVSARLAPSSDEENVYTLEANGVPVELTADFLKLKTAAAGGGTILARDANAPLLEQEAPARSTTANAAYFYAFKMRSSGGIFLKPEDFLPDGKPGDSKDFLVTVITNTGVSYEAPLTVTLPLPEESPSEAEEEPVPSAPDDTDVAVPIAKKSIAPLLLGCAGAAIVLAVALALFLTKKKK